MESVRSLVFNFVSSETSSTSSHKYPSNVELAKKFESRRKRPKQKPAKKKKEQQKSSVKPTAMKKPRRRTIRELLKQKAESSLAHLKATGKVSQPRKNSTAKEVKSVDECDSSREPLTQSPYRVGKTDSKSFQSKTDLRANSNKNSISGENPTTNSTNKVIVVSEWDGQSNSYVMNLNVKVPAMN